MARGSEGKAARVEARKEKRKDEKEGINLNGFDEDGNELPFPTPGGGDAADATTNMMYSETSNEEPIKKKKRKKAKKPKHAENQEDDHNNAAAAGGAGGPPKQPIKMGPLILLLMMTGTTLIPALLFAGDKLSSYLSKHHIMGNIGHTLGIGPTPKKRVVSFYEKHDPEKISTVDSIMAKYYGDYPKLIKRLERKYSDYGYFLNWEDDEAAMKLAFERLYDTRDYVQTQFNVYAPRQMKVAVRNIKFNLGTIYTKGHKFWKKTLWPVYLEPLFGVPDGAAAQKKKDRDAARNKGGRRKKNTDYRDD